MVSAIYKPAGTTTETTYYYGYNWRGDVVALYNADGSKFCNYEYDAWGKVVSVKRASGADVTSATHFANFNPFRYRSYYYDTDSGLYYLMSRYYDPTTCRFVNADGYFQSGGAIMDTNMNAYCRNNPVSYYDPFGTCPYYIPSCSGCNPDLAKLRKERGEDWAVTPSNPNTPDSVIGGVTIPTGPPNSKDTFSNPDGTPKQDRWYDSDGRAERDRDYNHPGDMPFPHDHIWGEDGRGKEHLEPDPAYEISWDWEATVTGILIAGMAIAAMYVGVPPDAVQGVFG